MYSAGFWPQLAGYQLSSWLTKAVSTGIAVGTASVERLFSQMKMIKTQLRSHLGEANLSDLIKITIESPETHHQMKSLNKQ